MSYALRAAVAAIMLGAAVLATQVQVVTHPAPPDHGPAPYRSATPVEELTHMIDVAVEADVRAELRRGR